MPLIGLFGASSLAVNEAWVVSMTPWPYSWAMTPLSKSPSRPGVVCVQRNICIRGDEPSAGVAKALGEPQVSITPLSGVNAEMVLTFAWDISWYQYRVTPEATQPVRLEERGHQ